MNYEIKSPKEASIKEIFFNKNTNQISYKNLKGIVKSLEQNSSNLLPEINVTSFLIFRASSDSIPFLESDKINGYPSYILTDGETLLIAYSSDNSRWEIYANGILHGYMQYDSSTPDSSEWMLKKAGAIYVPGNVYINLYEGTLEEILIALASGISELESIVYGLQNEWTETVVNISSAQILAMGSTPIELLPAPGVGNYYVIDSIILEYTHVTTVYVSSPLQISDTIYPLHYIDKLINSGTGNNVKVINASSSAIVDPSLDYTFSSATTLNNVLLLTNFDGNNPTSGDGTLRAIIKYKIRTFGVQ